jgi:hypothetical protein
MLLLGCSYEDCWPIYWILLLFGAGVFAFNVGKLVIRRWRRR